MRVDVTAHKDKPGYFTVTPHGAIESESHAEFRTKITPLLVKTTKGIIVDMENVDYISSAGLGVLFSMKKFLMEGNNDLFFCHLKPQIQRLFDIVKALPRETIFTSLEEADEYFYREMNEVIDEAKKKKNNQ
jgi:anti-anti-sigma factor